MTKIQEVKEAIKLVQRYIDKFTIDPEEREAFLTLISACQKIVDIDGLETIPTAEELARKMHRVYEWQAKIVGWKTQDSCQVPFDNLPETNKKVMLVVAESIRREMLLRLAKVEVLSVEIIKQKIEKELLSKNWDTDKGDIVMPRSQAEEIGEKVAAAIHRALIKGEGKKDKGTLPPSFGDICDSCGFEKALGRCDKCRRGEMKKTIKEELKKVIGIDEEKLSKIIQSSYYELMYPDITEKDAEIVADSITLAILDHLPRLLEFGGK